MTRCVGLIALLCAGWVQAGWNGAPASLKDTGLYADWASKRLADGVRPYSPQYPLWTDGAQKLRFIRLPAGARIDARHPDAWAFPAGTRLWKEFRYDGRRVETRMLERTAEGWRFATYAWTEDESDAPLAPEAGVPQSGIPGALDCGACHEGGKTPVLGFSALQLSDDRDPLAPHADRELPPNSLTLSSLVREDLIAPAPKDVRPRIDAATPEARAALGYLYGNCGHCHNSDGPLAPVGLDLLRADAALRTTLGMPSRFTLPGEDESVRVLPGRPAQSALVFRMKAQDPFSRMPPLGTRMVDQEAVALIERWISSQSHSRTTGAKP